MKVKLLLISLFIIFTAMTNDKPAYQLYNVKGKKANFSSLVKDAASCQVVLFGELHNNPVSHWLELQLAKELFKLKKQDLILGAEMFESDNQAELDKYMKGEINEDSMSAHVRLWPNYETDYRPLVEFARNTNLKFIATNIPRKYASMVNKGGFEALDALTAEEKLLFAPLPVDYDGELDCYKKMLEMNMGGHQVTPNFPKAQAIKDATMAYFINKNNAENKCFLHFNGSYHSDNFEAMMWYLKRLDPYMKVLTIATVEQSQLDKLSEEYILLADYIIVVPDDMTKTY
ncbi:MAG: ChaN family lipoprotein [Bacteroidota bacterium]